MNKKHVKAGMALARKLALAALDERCPTCDYAWRSRVKSPKKCPMCQAWLNKEKALKEAKNARS